MSYPICVETIRRVQTEDGNTLDVRPWPEAPNDAVALMNSGKESEEYFGKVEIAMSPEFARLVGESLIHAADEMISAGK